MNQTEDWWLGALAPQTTDGVATPPGKIVDLGPQHPSRAGLLRLRVDLDDRRRISSVAIQPGFLHRGAEKLFEVRDYRQVLMLADRHDWQAPFSGELVAALACEQLLGLSAPPRAVWLRTLLAEVARIHSHLGLLTWVGHALADRGLSARTRRARDTCRELMLALSGNRLHPMLNRLGGLAGDPDPSWFKALAQWLDEVDSLPLRDGVIDLALPGGLAEMSFEQVQAFGVSGPAARASGWVGDLRRQPGYLAYSDLEWPSVENPVTTGDVTARFLWLTHDIQYSTQLVRQCVERLAGIDSPITTPLSRIIKLPDAETWLTIEAPLGLAGIHVVSRGGTTAWRFKLRTPTFAQVNVLQQVLVGVPEQWAPAVIASFGYTIGDLDK
ncbi:NADH-quinone oxidoreductase subunit D [Aestuariimicrobium sp. Y1814]|uniref:NADH-quinone oxidoreductase subunit D-related protein n=1 Tax=Aestuariimicrobium sp. Y1814 TaxID=3418742 RepID=UPI003DA6FEE0